MQGGRALEHTLETQPEKADWLRGCEKSGRISDITGPVPDYNGTTCSATPTNPQKLPRMLNTIHPRIFFAAAGVLSYEASAPRNVHAGEEYRARTSSAMRSIGRRSVASSTPHSFRSASFMAVTETPRFRRNCSCDRPCR